MSMPCSPIARTPVIAEDARLAAQISCALALPGPYLPVVEGPRFLPPDPTAELVRLDNPADQANLVANLLQKLSVSFSARKSLTHAFGGQRFVECRAEKHLDRGWCPSTAGSASAPRRRRSAKHSGVTGHESAHDVAVHHVVQQFVYDF
jgi:hypothetical protein